MLYHNLSGGKSLSVMFFRFFDNVTYRAFGYLCKKSFYLQTKKYYLSREKKYSELTADVICGNKPKLKINSILKNKFFEKDFFAVKNKY